MFWKKISFFKFEVVPGTPAEFLRPGYLLRHPLKATWKTLSFQTPLLADPQAKSGQPLSKQIGYLPQISLIGAIGLLLLAITFTAARTTASWAEPAYWLSLLLMFVPVSTRLLYPQVHRTERIGLLMGLGLEFYLVKIVHSPLYYTYHDELLHWQTANDIERTHHLFQENAILPVSPLYPGLEIITNAISSLSGLPIFVSGVIMVAVFRLVFILSLYLLFELASASSWAASIGVVIYTTCPNFLFFNAQFAYESIALPFAVYVLYLVACRTIKPVSQRLGLNIAALTAVITVVISHHLTSFALSLFLMVWMGLYILPFFKNKLGRNPDAGVTGLLVLVGVMAWLVYVANLVVGYLAPIFSDALKQVVQLIGGESAGRELFKDKTGEVAPLWERLSGLGSTAILILMLPFGMLQLWWKQRNSMLAIALFLGAIAYPASLGLRFTSAGADVAGRATSFLIFASSYVAALAISQFWLAKSRRLWRVAPVVMALSVMFVGSVIVGVGPGWIRLPGPYIVSADMRSIERESIEAGFWTRDYLGTGNRFGTDRINRLMLGAYGEQRPVTNVGDKINIAPVFFDPAMEGYQTQLIRQAKLRYLLVDLRISTGLPKVGVYFEQGEPDSNEHTRPVDLQSLLKFDRIDLVNRVFDSGNILIYDIGALQVDRR